MERYTKIDGVGFLKLGFDEKGAPREITILNTEASKRFAGFTMMVRDLDLAANAIYLLKNERQSTILQQSLLFLAVSMYAKCFTKNDGHRPSLNFNDIFKKADQCFIEEHTRIMTIRHEYIAHAGGEFDKCIVTGTIMRLDTIVAGIDVNSQLMHTVNMPPKLQEFAGLCSFVKQKVEIKAAHAFDKIRQSIAEMDQSEFNKLKMIKPDPNQIYKMKTVTPGDGSVLVDFVLTGD